MAYSDTSLGSARTGGNGFLSSLVERVTAWQRARATAHALRGLSAHQLADIGIDPSDIDGFAERLATRSPV